jgi:hypothetical protein
MNRKAAAMFAVLVGMSLILSGCLAAAVGGAAAGAGGYAWSTGKLSFTTPHSIRECHDATISALQDLGITVLSDRSDNLSGRIKGETATGDPVAVDLEPQASGITKIDVRVGFWGSHTHSVRIADAIKRHLR